MSEPSELSRALEPLFRAYLRRLNEMAARVPEEALLREVAGRGDDGKLLLGPDGFPLRFDLANSETGETFEVLSGAPDAPAAKLVRVGALEASLLPGRWEALRIDCAFDGEPLEEDATAMADLLRSFAELAAQGGFAERREFEPWLGRVHAASVTLEGSTISALFDMGSCPPAALDTLLRALDGFGRDRAPLGSVVIGGSPPR